MADARRFTFAGLLGDHIEVTHGPTLAPDGSIVWLDRRSCSAPTIVAKNCRALRRALRRLRHHRARRRFCNRAPMTEQIGDLDFIVFAIQHRPWVWYG
jgi:hypothetical protein